MYKDIFWNVIISLYIYTIEQLHVTEIANFIQSTWIKYI